MHRRIHPEQPSASRRESSVCELRRIENIAPIGIALTPTAAGSGSTRPATASGAASAAPGAPALAWNGGFNDTRLGYALGGGGEYAFTNNITFKVEYLYYDLGKSSFAATGNAAVLATPALNNVYYTGETRTAGSLVRAGLNVKF